MAGRPTSGTRAALPHAPAVSAAEEQLRACPSSGAAAPGPAVRPRRGSDPANAHLSHTQVTHTRSVRAHSEADTKNHGSNVPAQ